jgi:GntR family transcriptional regulator
MFCIDPMSRCPVYEQLVEQAETYILKHILSAGDQMPSVRSLSIELSINPNTVQKAYSELDSRGIIYSVPGKGCFISDDAVQLIEKKRRTNLNNVKEQIKELKLAGITKDELTELINQIYDVRGAEK